MTTVTPGTVEVFNADYRSFCRVPWPDSVRLILRGAVSAVEFHSPSVHIHSPSLVIELPMSVILVRYAHRPYRRVDTGRATRDGILSRDRHTCVYCGGHASTIDHVLPRSRGGGDTWLNLVSACEPCNGRKDDHTPREAGMPLLWEPYEPREKDRFAFRTSA
jgi:5-methylcytosine-specific restriction endonuclease McrA